MERRSRKSFFKTLLRGKVMKYIVFFLSVLLIGASKSYAFSLNGRTYPIAEPDLITEIYSAAKHVDFKKIHKEGKKLIMNYYPKYDNPLPASEKSFYFYHKFTYTLKRNIPYVKDGKIIGNLYPAGYKFDPLKYMPFNLPTFVIFSIKNKYQRWWVFKHYGNKPSGVMLMTTTGRLKTLIPYIKKYKMPIYYNMGKLDQRFGVKNTISIVKRSRILIEDFRVQVVGMRKIKEEYRLWQRKH